MGKLPDKAIIVYTDSYNQPLYVAFFLVDYLREKNNHLSKRIK